MTRQTKPRGLINGSVRMSAQEKTMSYSYAVLQCLAAVIDPDQLTDKPGDTFVGESMVSEHESTKDNFKASNLSEVVRYLMAPKSRYASPVAELLNTLRWMREDKPDQCPFVKAFRIQRLFAEVHAGLRSRRRSGELVSSNASRDEYDGHPHRYDGRERDDAADWTRDILNCLAVGRNYNGRSIGEKNVLVQSLFRIFKRHEIRSECNHTGPYLTEDSSWFLQLDNAEGHDATILDLLDGMKKEVQREACCHDCAGKSVNVTKTWVGFHYLPEILIIKFNRNPPPTKSTDNQAAKLNYHVRILDEELEVPLLFSDEEKTKQTYTLRGFVKHEGDDLAGGHYIAFTQSKDEKWWKCNDEVIKSVDKLADATPPGRLYGGHIYLAFFQNKRDKT